MCPNYTILPQKPIGKNFVMKSVFFGHLMKLALNTVGHIGNLSSRLKEKNLLLTFYRKIYTVNNC